MKRFAPAIIAIIGGVLLLMPTSDVLSQCHAADRASQVAILRDAAAMPAETATERRAVVVAVNDSRATARTADWVPFTDLLAESIEAGTLGQMADQLEAAQ